MLELPFDTTRAALMRQEFLLLPRWRQVQIAGRQCRTETHRNGKSVFVFREERKDVIKARLCAERRAAKRDAA